MTTTLPLAPAPSDGPASKKRKIQNGDLTAGNEVHAPVDVKSSDATVQFYISDVSFAIPQRKKFTLEVTAGQSVLRARNQATKEIDFGVPMDRIREYFFCCHYFLVSAGDLFGQARSSTKKNLETNHLRLIY